MTLRILAHPPALTTCLTVLMAALLPLLLAACAGGDDDGSTGAPTETGTASRTPVGTLPTMEASPTGTATAAPEGTPSPSAGSGGTTEGDAYGIATVDVETGDVEVLHEAEDPLRPAVSSASGPWPSPRNGAIWLSPSRDEAVRYALDGGVDERVEGWGVVEADDPAIRSYFREGDDGGVTLVVERGGETVATTDGEQASNRAFSPDGRWLAWLDATPDDRNLIMVLELETGEVTEVASVHPCLCDGYHYIDWSPSSRYLAYEEPAHQDPSIRGIYVYDVTAPDGERRRIEGSPVGDGWIEADDGEYLLAVDGQVPTLTLADAPEGEGGAEGEAPAPQQVITFDIGSPNTTVRASTLQGLVVVTHGQEPSQTTMIFDPVSGERVREVRGVSDAVLTPDGIATATVTRNDIACTGVEVDHPAYEETLDCTAENLRWSPDGRYLALIPQAQSAAVEILDVTTGEIDEVPHAGPRGTAPEWSEDARYLVWVWGGQL